VIGGCQRILSSLPGGLAFTYAGEYLTGTAGAFPSLLRRLREVIRQSVTTESMKACRFSALID